MDYIMVMLYLLHGYMDIRAERMAIQLFHQELKLGKGHHVDGYIYVNACCNQSEQVHMLMKANCSMNSACSRAHLARMETFSWAPCRTTYLIS